MMFVFHLKTKAIIVIHKCNILLMSLLENSHTNYNVNVYRYRVFDYHDRKSKKLETGHGKLETKTHTYVNVSRLRMNCLYPIVLFFCFFFLNVYFLVTLNVHCCIKYTIIQCATIKSISNIIIHIIHF